MQTPEGTEGAIYSINANKLVLSAKINQNLPDFIDCPQTCKKCFFKRNKKLKARFAVKEIQQKNYRFVCTPLEYQGDLKGVLVTSSEQKPWAQQTEDIYLHTIATTLADIFQKKQAEEKQQKMLAKVSFEYKQKLNYLLDLNQQLKQGVDTKTTQKYLVDIEHNLLNLLNQTI